MSSRLTPHASRLTLSALRLKPDLLICLLLFSAGLYAYTSTLAPTVLEGDAALFQYTPYVLGVTYPTGFPLYILLGKVWLSLFPFGEIAWRMNLFSAVCSALALPLLYAATRRLFALNLAGESAKWGHPARWAALTTVLTFATLRTFWRWSTEAKTYALNILLFAVSLYLLVLALERHKQRRTDDPATSAGIPIFQSALRFVTDTSPLALPALLLGLQISVHNTAVLLLPGLVLLAWLNFSKHLFSKKIIMPILLLIIPGLFYLYIPLRAEWLIAHYGRLEAIQRGLLADFYFSGLDGLIRYFSATDFTGGVVTNWGLVPQQFFTVYLPILVNNFSTLGVGMGLIGGLAMAWLHPRLFWPLFLIYATPIPFVLTYGQGEQSAFLLPSFLIFSIFAGNVLILVYKILSRSPLSASRFPLPASRLTAPLLFLLLIPTLFLPQTRYNLNRLDAKWNRAMYDEWADALAHPLEPGAAMLAHWGDLTTFWYMQTAEGRRPDLLGLYPPTEEVVANYLAADRTLYIAGPLQGWAAGIEARYQLIPWGRLVRIAPCQVEPQTLLPRLSHPSEAVFDNKLRLLGFDYPPQANDGSDYAITLTWQALADLPPETTISLRLSQGGGLVAQLDDTLLSGWFPRDTLPQGQYVLSYAPIPIPLGTLPGKYRLQLVAYTSYKHPWPLADGTTVLDLGEVEIISLTRRLDLAQLTTIPGHDFNGEIELADYSYTVARVGQGKGFGVKLLWRAKTEPLDNYTLLVEAVDQQGNIIRAVEHQPAGGLAPTAGWQPGQYVRDQVDLVLPASAPVGQKALQVRLSWLRPDGSKLAVRRWRLPVGDTLNLDWLEVTEKEERVFEAPELQYSHETNFENKTRFLGYNSTHLIEPENGLLQFSQGACAAAPEACQIHFDFYWQGIQEMDQLYSIFLHVVDEQGQIVAQHDLEPGKRGKQPTTSWLPGEVVLDPVDLTLSPDLPPGLYTLRLGMYLHPDGPRLLVWDDEEQPTGDFIEVGLLEVRP